MAKDGTDTTRKPLSGGAFTSLLVSLAWLGLTTYTAHATITGTGSNVSGVLAAAAAALPGVVAAMLLTGATIGAAAGRRRRSGGRRLLVGVALGTLFGLAAAAGIRFAYGDDHDVTALAMAVGAASIIGAALAVLPTETLRAGLWGTTWVFIVGALFGVSQPSLVKLLDGGEAANSRLVLVQSVVVGLVAAVSALRSLQVQRNRALAYLVAGAIPGLVLLAAAWLSRAGGSAVADVVHGFGSEPPPLAELSDSARLRYALTVLAAGALIAAPFGALKSLRSRPGRVRAPVSQEVFHEGLARIGLDAGEPYGFVLAGGYAMRAAGLLQRSTEDIDLFTVWDRRGEFETAARAITEAYRAAGLTVQAERRHDTFTRLTVSDGVQTAAVDLGVDLRANEPVRIPIGPVLHPDDVVANKMRALYERGHACDLIDIDAVLRSGRYDRAELLRLATRSDISFDRAVFADALARVQTLNAGDFAPYGLVGTELDDLRHRFALWRAELLDTAGRA